MSGESAEVLRLRLRPWQGVDCIGIGAEEAAEVCSSHASIEIGQVGEESGVDKAWRIDWGAEWGMKFGL